MKNGENNRTDREKKTKDEKKKKRSMSSRTLASRFLEPQRGPEENPPKKSKNN